MITVQTKHYCYAISKVYNIRIDEFNRLVYNIIRNGSLWIIACRGHYETGSCVMLYLTA